jgi:sporulation protein YlmC with PRC-barrel domain
MKKATKFDSKLVAGTLSLVASGWIASQALPVIGPESAPPPPQAPSTVEQQEAETGQLRLAMMKLNKCSQLIGTTVENRQRDKLGKIEDLVVDYDTGDVSYCVLRVAHGISATPKYLAVPLAALQPAADGQHVILNAEKDKLAQAQGFDRNNWPSVSNPAWGAQPVWQTVPKAAITAPSDQNTNAPSGTSQ